MELESYIAAGCLALDKADSRLSDDGIWSLIEPGQWYHFGRFGNPVENGIESEDGHFGRDPCSRFLEMEIQHQLISSRCLLPFADLLRNRWIHMSVTTSTGHIIIRVYLLPDDVGNRTIPRRSPSLLKARLSLLAQLDFSKSTWEGQLMGNPSQSPPRFGDPETTTESQGGEGQSLLQMFNSIPSPQPDPEAIPDYDARDAAYTLINSKVPGLLTTLYAYQRRSAALMLQRESQRQKVLDPRLMKVVDQLGRPWYYDPITGTGLREPRHYDGPCGGILAEEMGAGKTLICLSLILATRHIPSAAPDHLWTDEPIVRRKVGSLADMAASCITRHSVPWRTVFGALEPDGIDYPHCVDAIRRNPAFYHLPRTTRTLYRGRRNTVPSPSMKVHLSHTSLVIVPPNLVQQWKEEIAKHTSGLEVLIVDKKQLLLPPVEELVEYDIILFSSTSFEKLLDDVGVDPDGAKTLKSPLTSIHFKRCIVDEGHRLGNSTLGRKSNLHLLIDHLQISAKWIVTGTPSKGLFGVNDTPSPHSDGGRRAETSLNLEKDDLKRIGSIAMFYVRMQPWANTLIEGGDLPADWTVYVMQPRSAQSTGRADCLKATLASLIIRNRLSDLGNLLPSVDEKVVYLDGCFQDRLALNLFSMMIIFNAVQSQRTDRDYFFHPRQRKSLLELVYNLRQASFFGGSFFSPDQIQKAIATAETFLEEGKVQISAEDESLLRDAINLGRLAVENNIKRCANLFREVPLYVQNFPWNAGREWSLDLQEGDPVCTDSRMVAALQRFLHPLIDAPASLQFMFETGRFAARGWEERLKGIEEQGPGAEESPSRTLAGNTPLGQDSNSSSKRRSSILAKGLPGTETHVTSGLEDHGTGIAAPLAQTQLVSTASAKLSYLIDQVVKYQASEQIIIFYENDNVAYYLAGVLEILQIQHLIYAKGLTPGRRAQYATTFNHNPKFRVLLMDMTQAAFGLDMQSASRIYFLSPVLNPQVEAQAIGRARRISQRRPVAVETLVLRGSVEEVVVRRRGEMSRAEVARCRSILDDRPIYEWVLNARILGMGDDGGGEMARLERPLKVFGTAAGGGLSHPDQDLVGVGGLVLEGGRGDGVAVSVSEGERKRRSPPGGGGTLLEVGTPVSDGGGVPKKKRVRVRFAEPGDEEEG
ncbi:P-loop containing nucleoside triphosphate hydrolase protein [Chaetomium fimeti]|uniref:P-loop containing nucleoside triphosphate hydrolase protein n=1 Tax=Chaetomium fimeti TaxID=1854472 RepID=A0AAE0HLR1_9PEZI|nr:P-loop containing nucleoside triphosphate hydrolase protein [Chaetomium fimeti]